MVGVVVGVGVVVAVAVGVVVVVVVGVGVAAGMSEGSFEAKLSAKRETAAGIYLTFQVQPDDYSTDLATLRVGSALMMGWAEVVDSKVEPILYSGHEISARESVHDVVVTVVPKERKPFASLPLSQQAAIRCQDNDFIQYLTEKYNHLPDDFDPAEAVRELCQVKSRAELDSRPVCARDWQAIEDDYIAWLVTRQYADSRR